MSHLASGISSMPRTFASGFNDHHCIPADCCVSHPLTLACVLAVGRSCRTGCRYSRSRWQAGVSAVGCRHVRGGSRVGSVRLAARGDRWSHTTPNITYGAYLADPSLSFCAAVTGDWRFPTGGVLQTHPRYSVCSFGYGGVLPAVSSVGHWFVDRRFHVVIA